jgi:four helix bundle protein
MGAVHSFRDLRVYQAARAAAKRVFETSQHFPRDERFSLTDQLRRASRSVGANIAEAWRKRRYPAAFVSKLSDADAETAEVQSWLDQGLDCSYIDQATHAAIDDLYDHIGAQLTRMLEDPDAWCSPQSPPPSRRQREI